VHVLYVDAVIATNAFLITTVLFYCLWFVAIVCSCPAHHFDPCNMQQAHKSVRSETRDILKSES
jgi:hypothetical protein